VRENITLAQLGQAATVINQHSEHQLVKQLYRRLRIKMPNPESQNPFSIGRPRTKSVLSRLVGHPPTILIFDEPTRGNRHRRQRSRFTGAG